MNINKEKYWKNFQLLTIVVMVGQLWCNLIQAWDRYCQLDFIFIFLFFDKYQLEVQNSSMIMRLLQHITNERYKNMMIPPLCTFNELNWNYLSKKKEKRGWYAFKALIPFSSFFVIKYLGARLVFKMAILLGTWIARKNVE
jgi:hypothetical protein